MSGRLLAKKPVQTGGQRLAGAEAGGTAGTAACGSERAALAGDAARLPQATEAPATQLSRCSGR